MYEKGILRPLEPLDLEESQQVAVTITDSAVDISEAWLDHEYMAAVDKMDEEVPTLDEVRAALSKIPGNLAADVRAERESRG